MSDNQSAVTLGSNSKKYVSSEHSSMFVLFAVLTIAALPSRKLKQRETKASLVKTDKDTV
jgi:hypothetical protein